MRTFAETAFERGEGARPTSARLRLLRKSVAWILLVERLLSTHVWEGGAFGCEQ